MTHPIGAITDIEELKTDIILGIPVEIWDIDMNTIRTRYPTSVVPGIKGQILHFKEEGGMYLKWFGFEDLTYNATEVLWSLPDDQIGKAEALTAAMYLFNTREQAVEAKDAHRYAQQLKRKALLNGTQS